jgi:plasmid stability protein
MPQVLIRDLAPEVMERLERRAQRNGRSLQAELKLVLEEAARAEIVDGRALAAQIRERLANRPHSDSVGLLCEDRER